MGKKKDYEVGYGKPPKHTQFRKGHSGNPSGKPKRLLTDEEILIRELSSRITVSEGGKQMRMTKLAVMLKKQVHLAMQGDPKAVRFVSEIYRDTIKSQMAEQEAEVMNVTLVFEEEEERMKSVAEENRQWALQSKRTQDKF